MIKKIILLGKPGAGKGTLSQNLNNENKNFNHISTGDIFRKEIKQKTKLGLEIIEILKKGDYVPNDITNEILKNQIINLDSFLLDGYPRTINQAKFLDSITKINSVVLLEVSDDVLIKRLSARKICELGKHIFNDNINKPKVIGICDFDGTKLLSRKDDLPKAIIERLDIYKKKTLPLIKYYEKQNKLIKINANVDNHSVMLAEFHKKVLND